MKTMQGKVSGAASAIWHTPTTPLKQLIEHGADVNARDASGRSLLARTMAEGKLKTAEFLRTKGATD